MTSNVPESSIDDDTDVMIMEVTSAPAGTTASNVKPPNNSTNRPLLPALNVMTKMGVNTANPKIIQALKIMQDRLKPKRGPREKATFQRYIYCLPDKSSNLPRFSSADEGERNIVKHHQDEGYGYPSKDYNNGMPLRTHLDVQLSGPEFDAFLKTLYPKLKNRYYEIYRIDKQRRLLRLETRTPRAIKDLKYQGSLIIIPYDDPKDMPPAVLFRCVSDERFALEVSHFVGSDEYSSSLSDNPQITEPVNPSINCDKEPVTNHNTNNERLEGQGNESDSMVIKIEIDSSDSEMEPTVTSSNIEKLHDDQPLSESIRKEADTSQSAGLTDLCGIFERTEFLRKQLKDNAFYIHIDEDNFLNSFIHVYRQYLIVLEHNVVVCCIDHTKNPDHRHQQNPLQPYLVRFWDEIFDLCFDGNNEKFPVCSPDIPEDIFLILGRIMYHGLILHNYWPVRLSQACCSFIMTDCASEKQLAESFQKVLSDEQNAIVSLAKAEIRSGATTFELSTQVNLCKALRPYGNTRKPDCASLNTTLIKISKFCLIQRPYWCLCQLRSGLQSIRGDIFQNIEEKNVFMFYSVLTPSALSLVEKIVYLFSTCEEDPDLEMEEKRVKTYLENFIITLHTLKLRKLLLRWCQSDCLNNSHVYVRFLKSSVCQKPVFEGQGSTLTLSSVYTSQEEFSLIMLQEL